MNIESYMNNKKLHEHKKNPTPTYQILHEHNFLYKIDDEAYWEAYWRDHQPISVQCYRNGTFG